MFLISILFVIISSYFITSVVMKNEEKNNLGFLYFLLITFAQVVLGFEILSLISFISKKGVLLYNSIVLFMSFIVWFKTGAPLYKINLFKEFAQIMKAKKNDKILGFLTVCFILFLFFELFIALFFPITFGDVFKYTLTRCTTWIQNGNINHFITPDTRELIMPVNLEFLYTWVLLFLKKENGIALFSFISYIASVHILYNLLGELKFSRRKRLWSVFIFSSFALLGVMAYTPCSDLFLGVLVLSSIYLFLLFCKYQKQETLYFSSLAYALAIGTKTTAIMMIPSVAIIFLGLLFVYKKNIKKSIFLFTLFFILNFLIFSSYNYILNFIQYNNPVSNTEQLLIHSFKGGFKGFLCNLIKYFFVLFDASGIIFFDFYNSFITLLQIKTLALIGETPDSYMSGFFKGNFIYNSSTTIATCAMGLVGVLAFVPSLIKSFICSVKKSKKSLILFLFALSFIVNIICISKSMLFAQFNIRYLAAFIVVASPILVYSYIKSNRNFFKWILCLFMFVYLVGIPHSKPIAFIVKYISLPNSQDKYEKVVNINREELKIFNYFKNKSKSKIGLITNTPEQALFDIEKLKLYGFYLDKILIENIATFDLSKYDYLITDSYKSSSTMITKYNDSKDKSAFVSQCLYVDKNMDIITIDDDKVPASVECVVPFSYLNSNRFDNVNDLSLSNYVVLKRW